MNQNKLKDINMIFVLRNERGIMMLEELRSKLNSTVVREREFGFETEDAIYLYKIATLKSMNGTRCERIYVDQELEDKIGWTTIQSIFAPMGKIIIFD